MVQLMASKLLDPVERKSTSRVLQYLQKMERRPNTADTYNKSLRAVEKYFKGEVSELEYI